MTPSQQVAGLAQGALDKIEVATEKDTKMLGAGCLVPDSDTRHAVT
jgi:hypothetical protein